jgi:hypothetical protein
MTLRSEDPLPHLAAVAQAMRAEGQPTAGFAALEQACGQLFGHRLFTVLLFHSAIGESERFYTNQPEAYPIGGRKSLNPTFWADHVLRQQKVYIGRSYDDIRAVFFDHELIRSLGCESVLNLPVVFDGRTLGTVNLLHEAGWYDESHVELGRVLAALAVPGLAMLQQHA